MFYMHEDTLYSYLVLNIYYIRIFRMAYLDKVFNETEERFSKVSNETLRN